MDSIHNSLFLLIDVVSTFIEIWGVLLVLITVVKEIYKTVAKYKFDMHVVARDEGLNHGLASALEVLLAAEILKTLVARTPQKLIEVAALVVIRIFIALILHWEMKQKALENAEERKNNLDNIMKSS